MGDAAEKFLLIFCQEFFFFFWFQKAYNEKVKNHCFKALAIIDPI